MKNSRATPPRPGAKLLRAPAHLERPEKRLWGELTEAHDFSDVASCALLLATMEAHQRARRCRESVDKDGETVSDRFGQMKPHPLLAAERDARSAFMQGMKGLGLDLAGSG